MVTTAIVRENTVRVLTQREIPYLPQLPLIDELPEEKWKTAQQIARRLIVLYTLTGLSHDADSKKLLAWLESESLGDEILDDERKYFEKKELSKKDIIRLSWNQESLFTLAWCLGLQRELPLPDREADLSSIFAKIPPQIAASKFVVQSKRIERRRILQEADLYYCYHWATRHPEKWTHPVSLSLDVVIERRRALDWVISDERFNEIALDT